MQNLLADVKEQISLKKELEQCTYSPAAKIDLSIQTDQYVCLSVCLCICVCSVCAHVCVFTFVLYTRVDYFVFTTPQAHSDTLCFCFHQ